jgi:lipopolysaccharide transport system ATP-binding protein
VQSTRALVEFAAVSKRFTIQHERARSFQDLFVRRFRRRRVSEEFWALQDVSFTAEPGSAVGIIGTNGSGKSTLLKLATRILQPTSGRITVRGRVSALLELGAGFHPELSGRDNVFLNGSILGLPRQEVAARFDAIVRFAGLERFIDIPVKHYSSGMYARLGFAVAIHVDPDILLMDEVLAVGDEAFQARCLESIARLHRAGKTLLLVSHDLDAVCQVCTQAIWLDGGRIRAHGDPLTVAREYRAASRGDPAAASTGEAAPQQSAGPHAARWGHGGAAIVDVGFLAPGRDGGAPIRSGDPLEIRVRYDAPTRIEHPVVGLAIATAGGVHVAGPNTRFGHFTIPVIEGRGVVSYCVDELTLLPGQYWVSASLYDESCTYAYDYHDHMYELNVEPGDHEERYGLVRLPGRWAHAATFSAPSGEDGAGASESPPPLWGRVRVGGSSS